MPSNYNNAAWFYDRLSRIVYGEALVNTQKAFLHFLPANANILLAGGGTGQIIEDITSIHPSGLHITYVEISEKMTARAKKRKAGKNTIIYINAPVQDVNLGSKFDVIITPFLLDNFTPVNLDVIFTHLHHLLKDDGLWLNADFQITGKWWQKVLLKTMYIFFNILGCMETSALPEITQRFTMGGYQLIDQQTFFGDFMVSSVYIKK